MSDDTANSRPGGASFLSGERWTSLSRTEMASGAFILAVAAAAYELTVSGFSGIAGSALGSPAQTGPTVGLVAAAGIPLVTIIGGLLALPNPRTGGVIMLAAVAGLLAWLSISPPSLAPLALTAIGSALALVSAVRNDAKRNEYFTALVLVAPFALVYAVIFYYPTYKMVQLSFTDAPLIGAGRWVGLKNFIQLTRDRLFQSAIWNTGYFVLLTVIPNTLIGLAIAMMVNRLKGWLQSIVLAAFFLPFILPVSVIYLVWQWVFDLQFGIAQYVLEVVPGFRVPVFRSIPWFLPVVGFVTIWWTCGFNILLFIAGLRAISSEIYECASLDGASRWQQFSRITWPLIWPVTALVLTIQLILQLKIFDQVYLFVTGGRTDATMVMVQYVYKQAFVQNHGGYGATVALALFVVIVVFSVLQYQVLRVRGTR